MEEYTEGKSEKRRVNYWKCLCKWMGKQGLRGALESERYCLK